MSSSDSATRRRREALARGSRAEAVVAERLQDDGWEIIARNWRAAGGELDIVAIREGALRFVEVKERQPDDPTGLESIDAAKQARLARAARAFLAGHDLEFHEVCFMAVLLEPTDGGWKSCFVDDAFDV